MLVFHTRLIALESLDGDSFLVVVQKLGLDRRVGQEDANDDTPDTT